MSYLKSSGKSSSKPPKAMKTIRNNKIKKISFRMDNVLYDFLTGWAMANNTTPSEAVRRFCLYFLKRS